MPIGRPSILGERVARLRGEYGWTLSDLAAAAQLSQPLLSRLESGEVAELKSEALRRLAQALHVSADYLLGTSPLPQVPKILRQKDVRDLLTWLEARPQDVAAAREFLQREAMRRIVKRRPKGSETEGGDQP